MSIDDKLDIIGDSLTDIKGAILNKGVTPSGNITTYASAIEQLSTIPQTTIGSGTQPIYI